MVWPEGYGRVDLDEVDSTQEEARRRAAAGEQGPVWIVAKTQTAGRGRRGREWTSPPGNLYATLLMRPAEPLRLAALNSFAACLSVGDLLMAAAPSADVAMKWPNDALLDGRKAAGVLLESESGGDGPAWLAIGVGVNLASAPAPEAGGWPTTSIVAQAGVAPSRDQAISVIASSFAAWRARLRADGFEPLRAAWLARAAKLGEEIEARLPRETVRGVFEDVDADGALVIRTGDGVRRIAAAEVHFTEGARCSSP